MTRNAVKLSANDNVASALVALNKGDTAYVGYHDEPLEKVDIIEEVPFGFKFAVKSITKGADILKYGVPMGVASRDIKVGEMVHVQNVDGARGRGDQ